jgi:hypothetical protein
MNEANLELCGPNGPESIHHVRAIKHLREYCQSDALEWPVVLSQREVGWKNK